MTLAAYLAWLAAASDWVANTTWAVCVLDTEAAIEDSTLGLFNSPATIRAARPARGARASSMARRWRRCSPGARTT